MASRVAKKGAVKSAVKPAGGKGGAKVQLEKSKNDYADLYDFAPVGYFTFNGQASIISVNLTGATLLGVERPKLLKRKFRPFVAPADAERWDRHFVNVLKQGEKQSCDLLLRRKDGSTFDARLEGIRVEMDDGTCVVRTAISDITERKILEEHFEKERQEFKLIVDSSPIIIFYKDQGGRLVRVNKTFAEALKMSEDELLGKTVFDLYSATIAQAMTNDDQEVIKLRRPKFNIIEQYESASGLRWVQTDKVPIFDKNGITVGLVGFAQDITERKQAEEALGKEKRFVESLIDTAQTIILVLDTSGYIVTFNSYMEEVSGYKLEEVKGKDWFSTFLPEDNQAKIRDLFLRAIGDIRTKGNINEIVTKNGKTRAIEWFDKTLKDANGNIVGLLSTGQDITERNLTEKMLQLSEDRYRMLVEKAYEGIIVVQDGKIVFANPRAYEMIGNPTDQVEPRPFTDFIHPDDQEMVIDRHLRRLKGEQLEEVYPIRLIDQNGNIKWTLISTVRIDWEGNPATLTFLTDITEGKKAEEVLWSEQMMLARTEGIAHLGSWEWDIATDTVTWSDELFRIFQRDPQEGAPSFAEHPAFYHPDDMARLRQAVEVAVADGTPYELELRAIRKDGDIRVCMARGVAEMALDGRPVRLVGSLQDITEHKHAEEELRKSEAQYRLLSEHTTDTVWLLDMNLKTTYTSPSSEKLLGFTQQELMEMPLEKYLTPDSLRLAAEAFFKEMPRVEADPDYNPIITMELEYCCKDGTTLWAENKFNLIRDENGKPISILGETRDITDRKQSEKALHLSEERYKNLFDYNIDGLCVIDETMQILMINQAAACMFGFVSTEEVFSVNPFDFIPQEERERVLETVKKDMFEHDRKQINEFRLISKAGKEVWVSAVGTVIEYLGKPAGLVSFRDITPTMQAEKTIEKQREEYRTIFDALRPGIVYLGKDGAIQRINKSGAAFFGLEPKEMVGKTDYDLMPAAEADLFAAENSEVISSGIPKIGLIHEFSRPSGKKRWIQVDRLPYLDEHGDIIGVIMLTQDITRRKLAEEQLQNSLALVQKTLADTVIAIAKMVEMKDPFTAGHQIRVAQLASAMAKKMNLTDEQVDDLNTAATIHDIGKIYVPSDILSKPGKLGAIEFNIIQTHVQGSYDILKEIDFSGPIAQIVYQHHERLDGSGYPRGLKGADILPEAKIMIVADVVEAMSSHRPYRAALGIEKALEEISLHRGSKYDEAAVDACLELFNSGKFEFTPA